MCVGVWVDNKWKANNKLHKYFGQTNNSNKMIPPQRFTPSKDPAQFQAETIYYVPHICTLCGSKWSAKGGGVCGGRNTSGSTIVAVTGHCCCRHNGTKITVAHTFACVKLSHNQYKVTFFIYFYDPTHSAYVRRLEAPDPTHPVLAIKSGQPLSLYFSLFLPVYLSFSLIEKFAGFVPCVHTECLLLYVQQIFSVAQERMERV